jgi:hypothetical protein
VKILFFGNLAGWPYQRTFISRRNEVVGVDIQVTVADLVAVLEVLKAPTAIVAVFTTVREVLSRICQR